LIFVVYFIADDIFYTNVVDAVEDSSDDKNLIRLVPKCATHPGGNTTKCTEVGGICDCHSSCCVGFCGQDKKCGCTSKDSACVGNEECCVGTCVNLPTLGKACYCNGISETCSCNTTCCQGFCDPLSATCKCIGATGKCNFDKDCCNGKCINGNCVCAAIGGACKVINDCCEGICKNGICGTCMNEFTSTCNTSDDCCRGTCSGGQCSCEVTSNNNCMIDNDCCGGTCISGSCNCIPYFNTDGSQPNCIPALKDPCCYGTCRLSSTQGFLCLGSLPNSECNLDYDCVTNVCDRNRCSCRSVGQPCVSGQVQCCNGLTCNNSTVNPTCQY